MEKITLFGKKPWPKKFDAATLIDFYINDVEEARHYLYDNLGYFIALTRFQGIFKEEMEENAGEITLFLDELFRKQIAKRDNLVDEKGRREIFSFIRMRLRGQFMNAKKKRAEDGRTLILDDVDLANVASVDDEYKESLDDILAELLFESGLTDDEIKVCILYTQKYSKNEIKKTWRYTQDMINETIDKLKLITKDFINKRQ